MKPKSISVVIPNFNGRKLIEKNINSVLVALIKAGVDYEVILVDDASTDDSVAFITKTFPEVTILHNSINQGFSPTINKGIMAAQKELVFALNSDVIISPEYFIPLMKYFDEANTFGVMGRIINMNNDEIQDAAKYPQRNGVKLRSTVNFTLSNHNLETKVPTLFLSGANALMNREKIQELKGFDEIYAPFYVEDVDLSIRAWRLGWKSYYEHAAICRHDTSSTIASFNKKRKVKIISSRNRLIFHAIHLEGFSWAIWAIQLTIELFLNIFLLRSSHLIAFGAFLKKQKAIKKSEVHLKQLFLKYNHKSSLAEIARAIKADIGKSEIIKF